MFFRNEILNNEVKNLKKELENYKLSARFELCFYEDAISGVCF